MPKIMACYDCRKLEFMGLGPTGSRYLSTIPKDIARFARLSFVGICHLQNEVDFSLNMVESANTSDGIGVGV